MITRQIVNIKTTFDDINTTVTAYDVNGEAHMVKIVVYDDTGRARSVKMTIYDTNGEARLCH